MRMSVDLPAQTRELSRSRRDWGVKLLSSQASRSCPASVGAFTGASCCDGEEVRSYITDSECSGPVTESTRPSARPGPTRLQLQPSSWKARSSTMRLRPYGRPRSGSSGRNITAALIGVSCRAWSGLQVQGLVFGPTVARSLAALSGQALRLTHSS